MKKIGRIFSIETYAAGHQRDFKVALSEERYDDARSILERVPTGVTNEDKIHSLTVVADGLRALSYAQSGQDIPTERLDQTETIRRNDQQDFVSYMRADNHRGGKTGWLPRTRW